MKNKKLLLGLGVVSLPILPLLVMTSCSSEPTHKGELTPVSFDIFDSIEKANVISTSLNHNIWENMMEKKSKLTVDELQKDFDSVITPLYLINQNKIKTPVKIIKDGIKVLSIHYPEGGIGEHLATLSVSYIEGESTEIKNKNVDWMIMSFISTKVELKQFETTLMSAVNEFPELNEYFLAKTTGIFDQLSKFQEEKDLGTLGGLFGYNIALNQILPYLMTTPQDIVGGWESIYIPSISWNNTFAYPSSTGSLDYDFNTEALVKLTDKEILKMTTPEELLSILIPSTKNSEMISTVKDIVISDPWGRAPIEGIYKIIVNFKDVNKLPEIVSITANLIQPNA